MAALSYDAWTLDGEQFVYLLSNASCISFLFVFINQFVCFGVAILIWGIINFGDHFSIQSKIEKFLRG